MSPPLADASDAFLMSAAQHNSEAFDILYRRYAERIYRYCYRHTGHKRDAEDLTAQVFLAVLESLGRYEEQSCFAAWLFGIARNLCAAHHRRGYAHPVTPLDAGGPACELIAGSHLACEGGIAEGNPERSLIRKALSDCLHGALRSISRERREAVYLRFWGGLRVHEVAEVMNRKTGAVKMLIWRGINDLRRRCLDEA